MKLLENLKCSKSCLQDSHKTIELSELDDKSTECVDDRRLNEVEGLLILVNGHPLSIWGLKSYLTHSHEEHIAFLNNYVFSMAMC